MSLPLFARVTLSGTPATYSWLLGAFFTALWSTVFLGSTPIGASIIGFIDSVRRAHGVGGAQDAPRGLKAPG